MLDLADTISALLQGALPGKAANAGDAGRKREPAPTSNQPQQGAKPHLGTALQPATD